VLQSEDLLSLLRCPAFFGLDHSLSQLNFEQNREVQIFVKQIKTLKKWKIFTNQMHLFYSGFNTKNLFG
jgi:hypothetical protein